MAGVGGFTKAPITGPAKGPTPTGPPVPQQKSSKPAQVQVGAHTRAAPVRNTSVITHVLPPGFKVPSPSTSPLLNPNQSLSGQALLNAAQSLAQTQTQAPITELQKQIAANNNQTQGTINLTGGYYNQLEPFVQQGVQQSGQIASGLNQGLQGINQQTQNQLQEIGQNAMASLAKYAPDANAATTDLAAQIARQQGLAAQQDQTYQDFGTNQGANYQQAANSNLGVFGLQGQEALRNIAQSGIVKNEPLVAKIAALRAQQGALTATDLGKLRQQEVANQIARQGLGLKQDTLKNTAAQNKARDFLTARGQDITKADAQARIKATLNGQQLAQMRSDRTFQLDQKKFGLAAAKDAYERAHGLGPYKVSTASTMPKVTPTGTPTLTPLSQEKIIGEVSKLPSVIHEMQQPLSQAAATSLQKAGYKVTPGQKLSEAQVRQLLASGPNPAHSTFDPRVVDAGYALAGYGYLTPKQITGLNKLGVIVGNRFRRGNGPAAPKDTTGGVPPGISNPLGAAI